MQIATAVLLLVALRKPLKGSIAGGQRVMIDWRLPTLAAAGIFLKFAGPICGIMLAKVTMFSEAPPVLPCHTTPCMPGWLY